jgi:hypothetical protein
MPTLNWHKQEEAVGAAYGLPNWIGMGGWLTGR